MTSPSNTHNISGLTAYKTLIKNGFVIGLGYGFSFTELALAILIGQLAQQEADPEKRKNLLAASALSLSTLTVFSIIFLLSLILTIQNKVAAQAQQRNPETLEPEQKKEIKQLFSDAIAITTASAGLASLLLSYSKEILDATGQHPEVTQLAGSILADYGAIAFPGLIFHAVFEQFLLGFSREADATKMIWLNLAPFTALAALLSLQWGYGLKGTTFALAGATYATCLSFGAYLGLRKEFKDYGFFIPQKPSWLGIKGLISDGAVISVGMIIEYSTYLALGIFIGRLGNTELAKWNYCSWVNLIAMIFSLSTSSALFRNMGGDPQNAKQYIKYAAFASLTLVLPVALATLAYPQLLSPILSKVPEHMQLLLGLNTISIAADAVRNCNLFALRGHGDFKVSSMLSAGGVALALPTALLLSSTANLKLNGMIMGVAIALTLTSCALAWRLRLLNAQANNEENNALLVQRR